MFNFAIASNQVDSSDIENNLSKLLKYQLLGLRISQFYSFDACEEIVKRCYEYGFHSIVTNWSRIGHTIVQFHSLPEGKKHYFDLSPKVIEIRKWIFGKHLDPVNRVGTILSNFYPCKLAFDEEYQQYYSPGIINIQNRPTKLHTDRVQYESYDWSLTDVSIQFSCVLYLQLSESGGNLEIYNRHWQPEDARYEFSKDPKLRKGTDDIIVKDCSRIEFKPEIGDLLLFNTGYYHQVQESFGKTDRLTSLSFCGINSRNEIVFFM